MTTSVFFFNALVFISFSVVSHGVSASLKHKNASGGSAISAERERGVDSGCHGYAVSMVKHMNCR